MRMSSCWYQTSNGPLLKDLFIRNKFPFKLQKIMEYVKFMEGFVFL